MKSLQVLTDINIPLDVIVLATLLHFSPLIIAYCVFTLLCQEILREGGDDMFTKSPKAKGPRPHIPSLQRT